MNRLSVINLNMNMTGQFMESIKHLSLNCPSTKKKQRERNWFSDEKYVQNKL